MHKKQFSFIQLIVEISKTRELKLFRQEHIKAKSGKNKMSPETAEIAVVGKNLKRASFDEKNLI